VEDHCPLAQAHPWISALRISNAPVKKAEKTWMMFQRAEGAISQREEGIDYPFSRPNCTEIA